MIMTSPQLRRRCDNAANFPPPAAAPPARATTAVLPARGGVLVAGLILGFVLGSLATLSVMIGGDGVSVPAAARRWPDAPPPPPRADETAGGGGGGLSSSHSSPSASSSCAWHPSGDGCAFSSDYPLEWADPIFRRHRLYDSHPECCRGAFMREDCEMVDAACGVGVGGVRRNIAGDAGSIGNPPPSSSSSSPSSLSSSSSALYSFVDGIVPESLRARYAPEALAFPVTESMLRRSRPVIGNNHRLHAYLRKLHSGKCTTVLFMGGSVTRGHGAGGPDGSYPKFFIEWLNHRYPCEVDAVGGGVEGRVAGRRGRGLHAAKRTTAQNSQTCFAVWNSIRDAGDSIDLVLMEFNVNDQFIPDLPHALEEKGPVGEMKEYKSAWYTEALLRRLLLLRKPDPVAIITFNADYAAVPWELQESVEMRKTLSRDSPEPTKLWISALYEIPAISASIWMLPLASKGGSARQFSHTEKYSTSAWHTDSCCHPPTNGHLILSLILAHNMVEEEKVLAKGMHSAYVERDLTADEGILRDPLYLSPEEDNIYVQSGNSESAERYELDFEDPSGENVWKDKVVANEGWEWYADNKDKDKYGLIANSITGGQHIAFSLTGGQYGIIEVSYVLSYENFGIALAWVDDDHDNTRGEVCNQTIVEALPIAKGELVSERLIAMWDEHVSVPTVQILKHKLTQGQSAILHFCHTPHFEWNRKGSANKFKLLGLRVY